jgi:hypothetical protein
MKNAVAAIKNGSAEGTDWGISRSVPFSEQYRTRLYFLSLLKENRGGAGLIPGTQQSVGRLF